MSKGALWIPVSIGIFLLLCTARDDTGSTTSARQPTPLDLSTAGTISGRVRFDGLAPEQTVLQLGGWSECAAQHPGGNPRAGDVLVSDGKLRNAVVYVKGGLG